MKRQTLAYSLVSVAILLPILGAGLYFYMQSQEEAEEQTVAYEADRPLSSYIPGQSSPPATQGATETPTSNSSSLEVKSSQDVPSQTQGQPTQLPEPAQFSVYEQFAEEENTQFIDILEGEGESVQQNDRVAVVYKGWLTNGTLFDQSNENTEGQLEPFIVQLGAGQVIDGWEQGLLGMKVNGQRRLIIPASRGYGVEGNSRIPPDSMLIFDVRVVDRAPQNTP